MNQQEGQMIVPIIQAAVSPEQALQAYNVLKEITKRVLVKDVDYGIIPGTPKPSLYKSGAENLLRFYGLGHTVEAVDSVKDWDNGIFYFEYKVSIHRMLNNGDKFIIAECMGSCSSREPKYYKYKNGNLRDPYEQVNTLQKMAIKRALVGAALQATGASGLFTQDIEDMPGLFGDNAGESAGMGNNVERTNTSGGSSKGRTKASDAQINFVKRLKDKLGYNDADMKEFLMNNFNGLTDVNDLSTVEISNVIRLMNDMVKETQG